MRITLLGTGTSHGVPTIDCMINGFGGCPTGVCGRALADRSLRRTRTSALLEWPGASVLIDTSQDFYQQVFEWRVQRIDAVLYTHAHADHIYGLPDIRSYCRQQGDAIDVYGSQETMDVLRKAFDYVFQPPEFVGGGIPVLAPHTLDTPLPLLGSTVIPIPVEHGALNGCQGYRVGQVAYIPDVKRIPPASLELLQDLDLLVLNCLRLRLHASHLSLEESLAYVEDLAPRRCVLTHIAHDIDPEVHRHLLPEGVVFGYDGMVLEAE